MILQWLKLKNIRSYTDQELHFPDGSILLSGDIGAGKTTILLAIEFALFGLIRGDTTGSTLLRHGSREGTVSLCFKIDEKEVIINRALKKSGKTISQQAGSIIVNGIQKTFRSDSGSWSLDAKRSFGIDSTGGDGTLGRRPKSSMTTRMTNAPIPSP